MLLCHTIGEKLKEVGGSWVTEYAPLSYHLRKLKEVGGQIGIIGLNVVCFLKTSLANVNAYYP